MSDAQRVDPAHIAEAAVLASRADHYLVRLAAVHEDDAGEAWQILINMENRGAITEAEMDRAAHLLSAASGVPVERLSG